VSDAAESLQPNDSPTTLDDLIASYLELTDGGHEVDPASFVAPWPQHRTEFLQFVARHAGLNRLATQPPFDKAHPLHRQTAKQLEGLESEFQLGGLLGKGGMGTVWAAIRRSDQQPVAIKVLNANMSIVDDNRIRFLREARAIQSLDHPHIVPCLDVGHSGGSPYLVMKLIEGVTLSDVVAEQVKADSNQPTVPLGDSASVAPVHGADGRVAECVTQAQGNDTWFQTIGRLVADITAGLSAAHEISIVHRDVKPSNLMLDRSGKIWLTDFGLASIGESRTLLTATGDILGTPAFMSPEQAAGNRGAVDHRTDIYSLGATLYTLAARRRPYIGPSHQIIRAVSEGLLTPPSKYRTEIPGGLEAIILKAMSRDPGRRYQSCNALEKDLRRFVAGRPVQARLPSPAHHLAQNLGRYPKTTFATAITLLFAVASVITIQSVVSQRLKSINSQLQTGNEKLASANEQLTGANQKLVTSRDQMRHLLYVSDVSAAWRAYSNNDTDTARELLAQQIPRGNEVDERGLEWHLLDHLSQPAQIAIVAGHEGSATEVAVLPGTNEFLTSGLDGRVCRWKVETKSGDLSVPQLVREFSTGGQINAMAVSPDGAQLVVGQVGLLESNTAGLHDLATGKLIRALAWHTTTIEAAAFSTDGTRIATASRYRDVQIHSPDGQLLHRVPADSRNLHVAFGADGESVLGIGISVDDRKRKVQVLQQWDANGSDAQLFDTRSTQLSFSTSSDCSRILIAGYDDVHLFDSTVTQLASADDLRGRIRTVAVSPDGQHLLAGCDNGLLHLWMNVGEFDAASTATATAAELPPPLTIDCGNIGITSIAFANSDSQATNTSLSSPIVLATFTDGSVGVVRPRSVDSFIRSPIKFQNVVSGPQPSQLVFAWARNGTLYRFDEIVTSDEAAKALGKFRYDEWKNLAVSPDESQVALSEPDKVTIVNAQTGEVQQSLSKPDPNEAVGDMAYSRDGSHLYVLFHTSLIEYKTSDWSATTLLSNEVLSLDKLDVHPTDGSLLVVSKNAVRQIIPTATPPPPSSPDGLAEPLHKEFYRPKASSSGANSVRYSQLGRLIAIGYVDGTIELVDAVTLERRCVLHGHRRDIRTLEFLNNDRTLVSGAADDSMRFWDVETARQLGQFQDVSPWCVVLESHDAILSYTNGRPLKMWRPGAK